MANQPVQSNELSGFEKDWETVSLTNFLHSYYPDRRDVERHSSREYATDIKRAKAIINVLDKYESPEEVHRLVQQIQDGAARDQGRQGERPTQPFKNDRVMVCLILYRHYKRTGGLILPNLKQAIDAREAARQKRARWTLYPAWEDYIPHIQYSKQPYYNPHVPTSFYSREGFPAYGPHWLPQPLPYSPLGFLPSTPPPGYNIEHTFSPWNPLTSPSFHSQYGPSQYDSTYGYDNPSGTHQYHDLYTMFDPQHSSTLHQHQLLQVGGIECGQPSIAIAVQQQGPGNRTSTVVPAQQNMRARQETIEATIYHGEGYGPVGSRRMGPLTRPLLSQEIEGGL